MKTVPAVGPTDSPLLALVGEAPGENEERLGKPFVGAAGHLLDVMLNSQGIPRSQCYITNVMDVRPSNNDFGEFYEDPSSRKRPKPILIDGRERLWKELKRVKPKVIVAFGNEPLKALTQEFGIKKWRGTMVEKNNVRILPTYHPAYLLHVYRDKPIVETDLAKAHRQALNPTYPDTDFTVEPTIERILDFLSWDHKRIVVDLETFRDPSLITRCIGIACSEVEALSFPLIEKGESSWSESEEGLILSAFSKLMLNPDVKKVFQNGPFDCTVLAKEFGIHVDGIELDTMFAHHLLFPELPKGLDFLSSIYTDFPMYWGKGDESDRANRIYNCYDCVATYIVGMEVLRQLTERDLLDFYNTIIHPAIFALTRMQNRGIKVNLPLREEWKRRTENKLTEIKARIEEAVGREINPTSTKQVQELAYDEWGLPVQRDPATKRPTTKGYVLELLARNSPKYASVLRDIILYREKRVLLSTFIETNLPADGRMRTSYNLAGTVTGRISSSKTITDEGANLQNIPRGHFRRIYTADPGHKIIKADYKQAEFRCVAWFAKIHRIIKLYEDDPSFDIHTWNAVNIFGVPAEQITKEQRGLSKNGVYGGNYKMGARKASIVYDIDYQTAKHVLDSYHRSVPEVQRWWKTVQDQIQTTRTLRNPLGRERVFFGRMDDELFRRAYSHTCQSTVADLILQAIATLDRQGIQLLLQVHDELVLQCREDEVPEVCRKVKAAMEIPLQIEGVETPLIIPVEIAVGDNWYDVEEIKDCDLQPLGKNND